MNEIYAFSKGVKTNIGSHQKINEPANVSKILDVLSNLTALSNVSTAKLNELKLDYNPKTWVTNLLKNYPKKVHRIDLEYLVSNLTDKFKTRMREESKYAIGLLSPNGLILCHSVYGEETITPKWNTIPRMLDTGNILRYVYFFNNKGTIEVKYWEKTASISFMDWLGLSRKQSLLFGGDYSIATEIDGLNARFELTEEEMEKLIQNHPEFQEGKINLTSSVREVNVNNIRIGNKTYEKVPEFIQMYEAENMGIPLYRKKYEQLRENISPLWFTFVDTKSSLLRYAGDDIEIAISKDLPDLDILFADDAIKLDKDYVKDFSKRLINNEKINIHHVALAFMSPPIVINKMKIYNDIQTNDLIKEILKYNNEVNLQDIDLCIYLKYIVLNLLGEINRDNPISSFFNPVAENLIGSIKMQGTYSKLEDKIIEYKSREVLSGDVLKIASYLAEDIKKKLEKSPCKIYIIGAEDDGTIVPVSKTGLKSDRLHDIQNIMESKLSSLVHIFPIIKDDRGIVLVIANKL